MLSDVTQTEWVHGLSFQVIIYSVFPEVNGPVGLTFQLVITYGTLLLFVLILVELTFTKAILYFWD